LSECVSALSKQLESRLVLESGDSFPGFSLEWDSGTFTGEVVFTTGMTGYPESLTDPSYAGQILCFTYPLIGNYGVPPKERWESRKIFAAGVVVSEACESWSHFGGERSFREWLRVQQVPLIMGVDTRALTKRLRSSGTMLGAITTEPKKRKFRFDDPNSRHLVKEVSIKERITYGSGDKTVFAVDCGMKENIVRSLRELPVTLHRVPFDDDFTDEPFDGVFLSNGPGDPACCPETVAIVKKAMAKGKPIFGICLGTQLLALAAGAKTFKLPFGHRGHNQPCMELATGACYVTSQNHGYAVKEKSLPEEWRVTFVNLNDKSVAGIAHKKKPFFAVQFHPEATPGPTDTQWLFEKFYTLL